MTNKINPNLIHVLDAELLNNTAHINERGEITYPDIETMRKAMREAYGSKSNEPVKYTWTMPDGFIVNIKDDYTQC